MKALSPLLIIVLSLLTFSCQNGKHSEPSLLDRIAQLKALGDSAPQEALKQLGTLEPLAQKGDAYERQKFLLLQARLRDKAYMMPYSADTMLAVVSYFEQEGTKRDKAEAYYYLASNFRDLEDYPQAIRNFLKAMDVAENDKECDVTLLNYTYSQLSYLYRVELNPAAATAIAKKSLALVTSQGSADPIDYMDVATSCFHEGDTLEGMEYAEKAMEKIAHDRSATRYADVVTELLRFYSVQRDRERAKRCLEMLHGVPAEKRPSNYFSGMANYYELFGPQDSAVALYEYLCEHDKTPSMRSYSARHLMEHYREVGNYERSSFYALAYQKAQNEIWERRKMENSAKANGEWVYKKNEAEIQATKNRLRTIVYWIAGGTAAIVLTVGGIYFSYRRRKEKELQSKEEEIEALRQILARHTEGMTEMQQPATRGNGKTPGPRIQEREHAHKVQILLDRMLEERHSEADRVVVEKFRKAAQHKRYQVAEADWLPFMACIDRMYPEFRNDIKQALPHAKPGMLRVCYLLKAGFTNPEIVHITEESRQTISNRSKKIREKMGEHLHIPTEKEEKEKGTFR